MSSNEHMRNGFDLHCSDSSEFLVLVKEDAGKSWQDIVGPEDPAVASETAPTRYIHIRVDCGLQVFFLL